MSSPATIILDASTPCVDDRVQGEGIAAPRRISTRWTLDLVRNAFAERGHMLTTTEYRNTKQILNYSCACGNTTCSISLKTFNRGCDGCPSCVRQKFSATMTKKYGKAHALQVPALIAKARATTTIRHGADSPMKVPAILAKARATMIRRYKVPHPSQVPAFIAKARATMTQRYQAAYPAQVPALLAKMRSTMSRRYGAANPGQVAAFVAKMRAAMYRRYKASNAGQVGTFIAKARATTIRRYGVAHSLQVPALLAKMRATMSRRYGAANPGQVAEFLAKAEATNLIRYRVRNPMQNTGVFQKNQVSAFSTKLFTLPSGRQVTCQGYEPYAINLLLKQGATEEDIVAGYEALKTTISIFCNWEGRKHRYYPDLYLPSQNKIIEIKSVGGGVRSAAAATAAAVAESVRHGRGC